MLFICLLDHIKMPVLAAGKREPEMALLDLLPLEAGIFS
jgi:hypothetical protein